MKNAGLRIRVERELRDEFIEVCRRREKVASEVLREFMQSFVETEVNKLQSDMFEQKGKVSLGTKATNLKAR